MFFNLVLCFVPRALCLCQVARVGGWLLQEHAGTLPFPSHCQLPSGMRRRRDPGTLPKVCACQREKQDKSHISINTKQMPPYPRRVASTSGHVLLTLWGICLLGAWHSSHEGDGETQQDGIACGNRNDEVVAKSFALF